VTLEPLWGIVCPGPTLRDPKTQELVRADAPVRLAAVNGAILAPQYPFDFWVVSDTEVFETCLGQGLYIRQDVLLLCPSRWEVELAGMHAMNKPYQAFRRQHHPTETNADFRMTLSLRSYPEEINWRESTVLMAIGLLISRGARRINLYAADMAGQGYFRPGLDNSRTIHTPKRWEREVQQLALVTARAADNGIQITRRQLLS